MTEFSDRAQRCDRDSLPHTLGGVRNSPASLPLEPHPEVTIVCHPILGGSTPVLHHSENTFHWPLRLCHLGGKKKAFSFAGISVLITSSPKFFFERGKYLYKVLSHLSCLMALDIHLIEASLLKLLFANQNHVLWGNVGQGARMQFRKSLSSSWRMFSTS